MNPNLLHWQPTQELNTEANESAIQTSAEGGIIRPPSYLSDDGVEYVLRAPHRSTVATRALSPARNGDNISPLTTPAPISTRATSLNVDQHLQNQPQPYQQSSHATQPPVTQYSAVVAVPPPSPPPVAAATYTPHTTSSLYSEYTPPVVQAPDFGASLVEQMLLHPAYRI